MRVTILGSGTSMPSMERFPSGILVRSDQATLLVDLGPGVLRRLAATGVTIGEIDAVLLTHYHVDHCADLAPLLFAHYHPSLQTRKPLRLIGGVGLRRVLTGLRIAFPKHLEPTSFVLEEREIEFTKRAYLTEPPDRAELEHLMTLLGTEHASTFVRTKEKKLSSPRSWFTAWIALPITTPSTTSLRAAAPS